MLLLETAADEFLLNFNSYLLYVKLARKITIASIHVSTCIVVTQRSALRHVGER
jgi:hypothetical protein